MIETKEVKWLIPGWLPEGMLTLLEGDPGLGKTSIALDIAARVSRGWGMPPGPRSEASGATRGGVLIISSEDSPEHVLRPRLEALGADLAKIIFIDGTNYGEQTQATSLASDRDVIKEAIAKYDVKLFVVDPLSGSIGHENDINVEQEVRRVMTPLKTLAEETGCTFLFLRHLNKKSGESSMYRGGGSIAILAAMRSVMIVGRHPEDPDLCVLAMNKINLAVYPQSLTFAMKGHGLSSLVAWGEPCDLRASDLNRPIIGVSSEVSTTACEEWLREYLKGGEYNAKSVIEKGKAEGFSEKTVRRAQGKLKVVTRKLGFSGGWMWRLPDEIILADIPE